MLDQVVIESTNPVTLNITAVDPDEILVVKSISGLTSGGVTNYNGDTAREGGYHQGRRAKNLTPTITLKLNPNYADDISVTKIRQILYKTFYDPIPGSDGVRIVLKDDELPDLMFIGYTEDINTDSFVKEQTALVSMTCTDPYLASVTETFESDPAGWSVTPIEYEGSAETGLEVVLKVKNLTDTVTFELNGNFMQLVNPDGDYDIDDLITISTIRGSRRVLVNGYDRMAHLTGTSKWVQLDRPVNTAKAYGPVLDDAKASLMSYRFRGSWWGN